MGPAAAAIQATTRPLVALAKPRTAALKGHGAMMRAARAARMAAAMRARQAEAVEAIQAARGKSGHVRDRVLILEGSARSMGLRGAAPRPRAACRPDEGGRMVAVEEERVWAKTSERAKVLKIARALARSGHHPN